MSKLTTRKVVLTGSTGKLGSLVLKHIVRHLPPSSIIVSLYNPSNAPAFHDGIEVRRGDFEDPSSLDKAFEGADVLFLISYPSIRHEVRVKAHVNAIEAAKRTGTIKHIVYTSLAFAGGPDSSDSVAAVMQAHLDTEAYLKSALPSDMTYTILREGIYTESFPLYLGLYDMGTKPSEVSIPPGGDDGLIAFTKRDDLGDATARIIAATVAFPPNSENSSPNLKEEYEASSSFANKTILLAAEPKHSLASLGSLIAKVLGQSEPVKLKLVSTEEYAVPGSRAAALIGSPDMAKDWTTTYPAIGRGETGYRGPGGQELQRLIGRPPESVEETLKAIFKAWEDRE